MRLTKEFDYSIQKIKDNLNKNTTDYVNMLTSYFLVIAFSILLISIMDKPNIIIYISLVIVFMIIFFLHGFYKMLLIIKRRIMTNKIIDNDEVASGRVRRASLECHRGRYDIHTLLGFMRLKVDNTWCYLVLPEPLPIKRIKLYRSINKLIKDNKIEVFYYKASKIIDLSHKDFLREVVSLSELKK